MSILRSLLYLWYRNTRFKKLTFPFLFLVLEITIALLLNWQLFGEKFKLERGTSLKVEIHNPLIIIKVLHSDRLIRPYGPLSEMKEQVRFYNPKVSFKAICYLVSLLCAYIGIFIALLWIRRFYHRNSLNIIWWLWPMACIGGHIILYLLGSLPINLFVKQF